MLTLERISYDVRDEDGQKEIIKDLSLTLEDNKFIVITGPNGGGKSTLARLIAGVASATDRFIFPAASRSRSSTCTPLKRTGC